MSYYGDQYSEIKVGFYCALRFCCLIWYKLYNDKFEFENIYEMDSFPWIISKHQILWPALISILLDSTSHFVFSKECFFWYDWNVDSTNHKSSKHSINFAKCSLNFLLNVSFWGLKKTITLRSCLTSGVQVTLSVDQCCVFIFIRKS